MSHHTQQKRRENFEMIKRYIAQTMPEGALDLEFRALLHTKGFDPRTLDQMLHALQVSQQVTFNEKTKRWTLPT